MKLSNCCGAEAYSNGDSGTEDYGICPDCKEHCELIEVCDECGGEGVIEKNVCRGEEGMMIEMDIMVVCPECEGKKLKHII